MRFPTACRVRLPCPERIPAGSGLGGAVPAVDGRAPRLRPQASAAGSRKVWKRLVLSAASSFVGPNSAAAPLSMTRTLSAPMMVLTRWAMVRVVSFRVLTSLRSTSWMSASVWKSTLAVASSRMRIGESRSSARAAQTSWRWPTERFSPPPVRWWPRPPAWASTKARSWTLASSSRSRASARSPKGSRLKRRLPVKPTGSWGMMARRRRSVRRPSREVSSPSMRTRPASSGHIRKSACSRELLPAPVRPTTPRLVPPGTAKVTPSRTRGRPGR
mmetsp:Transcript_118648/g.369644  ORF Transcript_118648/g.369644 Transcript_118648/m.369644 type:complete len:273 (+) Transcript_118648:207-1025(+)